MKELGAQMAFSLGLPVEGCDPGERGNTGSEQLATQMVPMGGG